ncbi:MAG TPA: hypothetical protein VNT99_15725, partial [Methylomirabilota bacterium]|nr:hypothetical protein [Methylomirabilota bacterium]
MNSNPTPKEHRKDRTRAFIALLLGALLWIPLVHWLFVRPSENFNPHKPGIAPKAQALAARHLHLWTNASERKGELDRMRRSNAEWDFMGRSFLVWSLAEMGLRDPARKQECLAVIDEIIGETLRLEREHGIYFFLMPYAKASPFVVQPPRSLFIDSEIALMLGVRRVLEEREDYKALLTARVEAMLERMRRSPALVAESYPDECWLFDHAVALAAIRVADFLDGSDHSAFFREWMEMAKRQLVHSSTGLLVSSFTTTAQHRDGPEGSSIWMAAHCLRLIDEEFALDQYRRARRQLGATLCGFGWSREWPASWSGPMDIDSGLVVPVLGISAGGSGLAFIGAGSFGDND